MCYKNNLSPPAVQYTALPVCLYNCPQSRRGEVGRGKFFLDDGGVVSVLSRIYNILYVHSLVSAIPNERRRGVRLL